ncbi:acyltransferase [Desulfobulbus sp.]|uniref:acyltransferase n=1 Tax=Desulfobulbus sp. TaxID=895 RepID=UPI0027B8F3F9|nr:acyltransferase [Desulfobulbus sp.]
MKEGKLPFIRAVVGQIRHLFRTRNSLSFIRNLRKTGVPIGEDVIFHSPRTTFVDPTRPYLIRIGSHVRITHGVTILTHGYDWFVLRNLRRRAYGSAGEVDFGNNVFIGMNALILKGVSIGDDTIVAAGSVITRSVPQRSVVAGNPGRVTCSIEEYGDRLEARQFHEAAIQARALVRSGRKAVPDDFREFFYFFLPRNSVGFGRIPVELQVGPFMPEFLASQPTFASFEAFLAACLEHFEEQGDQ